MNEVGCNFCGVKATHIMNGVAYCEACAIDKKVLDMQPVMNHNERTKWLMSMPDH